MYVAAHEPIAITLHQRPQRPDLHNSIQIRRYIVICCTQILHGCDANAWSPGPGGCVYSLLHKAIKLRETLACTFLIKNGADINSPFRPGAEWKDTVEANFASPLHMACSIGLEAVVQCLVEHHADVNQKVCICVYML